MDIDRTIPAIEPVADVRKRIVSIAKRLSNVSVDFHFAAMQALLHASEHANFSLASELIACLPKSFRRRQAIDWFRQHGPFVWSEKTNGFKKNKRDDANAFDLEHAAANPFWEEKERIAADFNLEAALKRLENLLTKVQNKLAEDERVVFLSQMKEKASVSVQTPQNDDAPVEQAVA